jgi:peptidoglycan hydrolase-like protein with peptidoglycan-binding domain
MSTQSPTTNRPTSYEQAPDPQNGGRSRFRIWIVVIGAVVAAAVVALVVTLSGSNSSPAPATGGTPTSTSAPAQPTTPVSPAHPSQPTTPVSPAHPSQPSAAVVKLQQELGQLNYYEGPDNGIMTPQTIQAIKYLQRDAHLPQTGTMNAATETALANFLAHGNNQMGGNS